LALAVLNPSICFLSSGEPEQASFSSNCSWLAHYRSIWATRRMCPSLIQLHANAIGLPRFGLSPATGFHPSPHCSHLQQPTEPSPITAWPLGRSSNDHNPFAHSCPQGPYLDWKTVNISFTDRRVLIRVQKHDLASARSAARPPSFSQPHRTDRHQLRHAIYNLHWPSFEPLGNDECPRKCTIIAE
jgi:hypothetical protein